MTSKPSADHLSKISFEKLAEKHIDLGWHQWTARYSAETFTQHSIIPPSRQDLVNIANESRGDEIWLAAYIHSDQGDSGLIYFANVHISQISWIDRRCTFGRLIGSSDQRGKGLGTELTRAVLKYCFRSLGMNKVTAGCLSTNKSAIKSNTNAGMSLEAVLKRDRYVNGEFVDTHLFGAWADQETG